MVITADIQSIIRMAAPWKKKKIQSIVGDPDNSGVVRL